MYKCFQVCSRGANLAKEVFQLWGKREEQAL